ncbi:MAG TPA: M48 family peptidase [Sulfurimonas sp.]|nr:M48 family peptidase [Sulfurimonas sp.]
MLNKLFPLCLPNEVVLDGLVFKIKHSLRKNMRRMILRVENKHELRISSSRVSKKNLLIFIQENKEWIIKEHKKISDVYGLASSFFYLNTSYEVKHHEKRIQIQEGVIYINPIKAKLDTDAFYKKKAREYLPSRVEFWKEKMNVSFNKLGFRLAKKRWGSCNSKRNISLNPYMMKLSYEMIDYIIVHELSHLVHLNHSKAFYETIFQYLPQHERIEKDIQSLSPRLS